MKYLFIIAKTATLLVAFLGFFSIIGILCMLHDGELIETQVIVFPIILTLLTIVGILLIEKYDVDD